MIDFHMKDLVSGDAFSTLVDSKLNSSREAEAVHQITKAMLAGQPSTHDTHLAFGVWLLQRCKAAGGARPLIVAHNAKCVQLLNE